MIRFSSFPVISQMISSSVHRLSNSLSPCLPQRGHGGATSVSARKKGGGFDAFYTWYFKTDFPFNKLRWPEINSSTDKHASDFEFKSV